MKHTQNKPPVVVIRRRGTGTTPENQPAKVEISPLPPKTPAMLDKVDRAVMLLGSRTKGDLSPQAHRELEELIGVYPTLDQAKTWKQQLKSLRKERIEKGEFAEPSKAETPILKRPKGEEGSFSNKAIPKKSRAKSSMCPPNLTPEQLSWIDAHWEIVCQHESGRFPGTLLLKLAKDQGFKLPVKKAEKAAFFRLEPLGERVMETHPEIVRRALIIWYVHGKKLPAADVAREVGLTTLETHGVLCRFAKGNSPPKEIRLEVEKKREEQRSQFVSLLYKAKRGEERKAMANPGMLEFMVKIKQFPEDVVVLVDGWKSFEIDCGEYEVTIALHPMEFRKLDQARVTYPKWIAMISGGMGPATEKGFVLLNPRVQVFERKPKEKRIPSESEQQSSSASNEPASNEPEQQNVSKAE